MKKQIEEIKNCCDIAQGLSNKLHSDDPQNDTFEQSGMLNGTDIINDFIASGESGCAVEHLLYMIHESDIYFPSDRMEMLNSIVVEFGIKNHYANDD